MPIQASHFCEEKGIVAEVLVLNGERSSFLKGSLYVALASASLSFSFGRSWEEHTHTFTNTQLKVIP